MQSSEPVPLTEADERRKFAAWRRNLDVYLGAGRFDLPPYQIRIKTKAIETLRSATTRALDCS
jgi:hypothetical protein